MYIESIIEKLNNPYLHDPENPGYKFLDGTVGEYLENYDNHIFDLFVTRASGGYLDQHARMYGLVRHEDESDAELRRRVLVEVQLLQSSSDFLSLDVSLWVYQTGVVDDKNVLTSRNPYLKNQHDTGYVFIGSGVDADYIHGRFIVEDILWV